ncbi:MAG TPA: pyruvate dehydrogenase (acetyl-transferring), homodimeric type, partial [Candidatus Nesterenkonia stercoripullorum]|nr:pyruvate dehydrogenase (acetyl-transferring), homodimeric type [Candidatus Nesterenkonia stercoripullorum]
LEAQQLLADDWGVSADVWSVTSWNELRRQAIEVEEAALMHAEREPEVPFVTQQLSGAEGPIVATTDYATAVPDQIRQFVPNSFATLGADSFGFSDTRAAARRHFRIDAHSMVVRALQMLADEGAVAEDAPAKAYQKYDLGNANAGTSGTPDEE